MTLFQGWNAAPSEAEIALQAQERAREASARNDPIFSQRLANLIADEPDINEALFYNLCAVSTRPEMDRNVTCPFETIHEAYRNQFPRSALTQKLMEDRKRAEQRNAEAQADMRWKTAHAAYIAACQERKARHEAAKAVYKCVVTETRRRFAHQLEVELQRLTSEFNTAVSDPAPQMPVRS